MQPREHKKFSAWAFALIFATTNCFGAIVDVSDAPLVASTSDPVRPNVYFIFDDSSSMASDFMPDSVGDDDGDPCFYNFGYNKVYYNPSVVYAPPVDANGNSFLNSLFTDARPNGFQAEGAGNWGVDLSQTTTDYSYGSNVSLSDTAFATVSGNRNVTVTRNGHGLITGDVIRFTGTPTGGTLRGIPWTNITWTSGNNLSFEVTRLSSSTFRFTAAGTTNATSSGTGGSSGDSFSKVTATTTGNYFYYTHATNPSICDSNGNYTRVDVYTQNATVKQNFANWYSYYRTRLLLMKTASGHAFAGVTDKYRVGFSTTSSTGTASRFLGNNTFSGQHRTDWYSSLYGVSGDINATPLRGSLSKAGRYYAGKLTGALAGSNTDPVQYACQRNFTILTTDGFWNRFNETSSFGPYREDNTTEVGDQDSGSGVPRPYRDGDGTHSNTLADVAMYYYNADLRPSGNDNVTGGLTDEGTHVGVDQVTVSGSTALYQQQNMFTFTLGLGVTDTLVYPTDLPPVGAPGRATSPIMQGTKQWPNPDTANTNVTVPGRTDDLWHAAENGRGRYISASNSQSVVTGLNEALEAIEANVGSSAAAATSTLQPVQDDNTAFVAQFETVTWTGNLVARSIDLLTGAFSPTPLWEAKTVIDAQFSTSALVASRNVYTFDSAAANKLRNFSTSGLTGTEKSAWFTPSTSPALSQAVDWNATQQGQATADALINFLRGDATLEGVVFRNRAALLGDIVNAAPVYVRKPPFSYLDPGYAAFAASNASRSATVYVGANDGMLHAINADTGQERWAYVPSFVLPNLKSLADEGYSSNHRFYVDGLITVGDVYDAGAPGWKTVLVAGLGKGGKGFFALDVTTPGSPKALWEFGTVEDGTGDADMGYSFGNPMITKRVQDGRWVAIFSSGYNNGGRGRIYVVDAITGVKLDEYVTSTTNDENLSGIGRAANLVPNGLQDNTTQYVYAGDLSGALWRFDIAADSTATVGVPSTGVALLGRTHATDGAQPITVRPELARLPSGGVTYTVVYFGTGRFLGRHDIGDSFDDHLSTRTVQSIYAVKDTGSDLGIFGDPADSGLIERTLVINTPPLLDGQKEREVTPLGTELNWASDNGWFFDVPEGERFNVNPSLQTGVLVMAANIVLTEESDRCNPRGASVFYEMNYRTGEVMDTAVTSSMTVGFTLLKLVTGMVNTSVHADGSTRTDPLDLPPDPTGTAIRISWREIE